MTPFSEIRFETGYIILNTQGGVEYSTDIVEVGSGAESRNQNWQYPKGAWDFGDRKLPDTELDEIVRFFRARKGRTQGFRFKDWGDFKDGGSGVLGLTGVADGTAGPFQMVKNYSSGAETDQRLIRKPVTGTINVFVAGTKLSTSFWSIDYTTGMITFLSGHIPANGQIITWTGEFDVPVRFDADKLSYRFDSTVTSSPGVVVKAYFYIANLPLIEVRA
jgi:uncharacterized protein (TIGR02217 family)